MYKQLYEKKSKILLLITSASTFARTVQSTSRMRCISNSRESLCVGKTENKYTFVELKRRPSGTVSYRALRRYPLSAIGIKLAGALYHDSFCSIFMIQSSQLSTISLYCCCHFYCTLVPISPHCCCRSLRIPSCRFHCICPFRLHHSHS
jgi:hypothetical protein